MPRIFQLLTPFVSLFPPPSLAIRFIFSLTFPHLCHFKLVPSLHFPPRFCFFSETSHSILPLFLFFPIILVRFIFPSFANSCLGLQIFKENTFHVPIVSLQYEYNALTFRVSEADVHNYRGL